MIRRAGHAKNRVDLTHAARRRTIKVSLFLSIDMASSASPPGWTPSSWRSLPIKQQPKYPDAERLEAALVEIRRLPPLVTSQEVDALRRQLAEVARGERFLLQGGDCGA